MVHGSILEDRASTGKGSEKRYTPCPQGTIVRVQAPEEHKKAHFPSFKERPKKRCEGELGESTCSRDRREAKSEEKGYLKPYDGEPGEIRRSKCLEDAVRRCKEADKVEAVHTDVPAKVVGVTEEEEEFLPEFHKEVANKDRCTVGKVRQAGDTGAQKCTYSPGQSNKESGKTEEKGQSTNEDKVQNEEVRRESEDARWYVLRKKKGKEEKKQDKTQGVEGSSNEGEACGFPKGEPRFHEDVNFCHVSPSICWGDATQEVPREHYSKAIPQSEAFFPEPDCNGNPQCITEPGKDKEKGPKEEVVGRRERERYLSFLTEQGEHDEEKDPSASADSKEKLPQDFLGVQGMLHVFHASIIAEIPQGNKVRESEFFANLQCERQRGSRGIR